MFSTGELRAKITSEEEVTVPQLVEYANTIWKECKKRGLKFGDVEASDKLLEEMQKKYSKFSQSYPIVLRYIVQMQEYSSKAFKTYLERLKHKPWKGEDEYLESQADYVVLLYKDKHPKYNETNVRNLRKNVLAMLKNEHYIFKANTEAITKEVEDEEAEGVEKRRIALHNWFKKYGDECQDITVRVESWDAGMSVSDASAEDIFGSTCLDESTESVTTAGISADDLLV